jgi:Flp pilus assembly protein TadB
MQCDSFALPGRFFTQIRVFSPPLAALAAATLVSLVCLLLWYYWGTRSSKRDKATKEELNYSFSSVGRVPNLFALSQHRISSHRISIASYL